MRGRDGSEEVKYASVRPLNSAPDAGIRISYYAVSNEAQKLMRELGLEPWMTLPEARATIERQMKNMNVSQRTKILEKMGRLIRA